MIKPTQQVKEVRTMVKTFTGKANLWNQLKELGFDSKQLKSQYGVSYQQANVYLLYDILEQLQNEVGTGVNESLSSECGGVTGNDINSSEIVVNSSEVNYKGFNYNPKNQYVTMGNTLIGRCLPENFITAINNGWFNSLSCCISENDLICQLPNQEVTETPSTIVTTETKYNITEFKGIPIEHHAEATVLREFYLPTDKGDNTVLIDFKHQVIYINDYKLGDYGCSMGDEAIYYKDASALMNYVFNVLATEREKINRAIANNIPHEFSAVLGGQQQKQVTDLIA